MATRARLQRRLAARHAAAGNANDPAAASDAVHLTWADLGMLDAEVDVAEDCGMSMVEEYFMRLPGRFPFAHIFPKNWSLHRVITALSICPLIQAWRSVVSMCTLRGYYLRLEVQCLEASNSDLPASAVLLRRNVRDFALICVANRLLLAVLSHLNGWDCLGLSLVCRRWHFVARCVWDRAQAIELGPSSRQMPALGLIRTSKIAYRLPSLSSITVRGGIYVALSSLPETFRAKYGPPIDTLRIYDVTFVARSISQSSANECVCEFLRSHASLKELVLVAVRVGLLGESSNRLEVRSLDLRSFDFTNIKSKQPLPLDHLQFSLQLLQRFPENIFGDFLRQLMQTTPKAVILCGPSSDAAGLSRSIFTRGFASFMPHLREISLCNISFSDGNQLGAESLELLSKQIGYNSSLELFCLTKGEISEEAICNFQRCAKLQLLILLRCEIIGARPGLALMAGWHPRADLPSSLITDDATVPRWFKPRYFRVVRVDNFTDFSKRKFVNLRNNWWTVRALMKSSELGLADFYFPSLILEPEEIVADAVWLHV